MRILHSVGVASSHECCDLKSPPQNEFITSYLRAIPKFANTIK